MANEWVDKAYSGGAGPTTLNGGINASVTSVTVTSGTLLLLDGSTGPFVISVDRTTLVASEEKMLVTSRSGNVLTVQRGYDGTAAVSHLTLASVEHVMDAFSIEQANAMAAIASATGAMSYRSGSFAYSQLALGATGLPLVAGASAPAYTALGLAGLAAAVQALLVPAGSLMYTAAAAAPSGWLILDGSSIPGADALYPALWAVIPAAWKSGTTFLVPDARGRGLLGAGTGAGLTARTLGALVGEESHLLLASESGMPANTPTGSVGATGFFDVNHAHNLNGITDNDSPDHGHQRPPNSGTTGFVVNGTGDLGAANIGAGAGYALNSITGGANSRHQHTINQNTGNAITGTQNHQHASGALTMNATPAVNAAAAHNNTQASLVVNTIIKAH